MENKMNGGNDASRGVLLADERGEPFKFFFFPRLLTCFITSADYRGRKINAFVIKERR